MRSIEVTKRLRSAVDELRVLAEIDPSTLDVDGCASTVAAVRRIEQTLAVVLASISRRAEALRVESGAGPGAEVLSGHEVTSRQANREADRASLLDQSPGLDAAFRAGALGPGHVDAVAATCARLEPAEREQLLAQADELVGDATGVGPDVFAETLRGRVRALRSEEQAQERFERQQRATGLRKGIDRESGMYWLHAEFDPVTGGAVFAAIDRATDRLRNRRERDGDPMERTQAAAHALVDSITRRAGKTRRDAPAEVLVLIDLDTLLDGLHDASICETTHGVDLPPGEVRRLAAQADLIPVVLGGDSEVLDVGRASRLATRPQRRALRVMHATCAREGCTVAFDDCDVHHDLPWLDRGETNLDNLRPLCTWHHHRHHRNERSKRGRNRLASVSKGARSP